MRVGPLAEDYRKCCRRLNAPNHAHYLTFTCFQGRPFLARDRTCQWLVSSILDAMSKHDFDVWAWVIMPEHVHLLIFPREPGYNISGILRTIKQAVANRAVAWVQRNAPSFAVQMQDMQPNGKSSLRFWQRGGGHDRNIISTEEVREKVKYIHENPVRRGLVGSACDWEWSSARDYAGLREARIPLNLELLPTI